MWREGSRSWNRLSVLSKLGCNWSTAVTRGAPSIDDNKLTTWSSIGSMKDDTGEIGSEQITEDIADLDLQENVWSGSITRGTGGADSWFTKTRGRTFSNVSATIIIYY